MRLVHTADLHVGYRAYQRLTPTGINVREADVARTLVRLIDAVIGLRPDLVVIGGDVFHESKPSNAAIVHTHGQFRRLTQVLPDVLVVIAAGNHDLVRASSGGDILPLLATIDRVYVADRSARWFTFPERELAVLAVPDAPGLTRPPLVPDRSARYNVLVLHGEVEGMLPPGARRDDRPAAEIPQRELGADAWDYCALGHWHQYRELAPNCYYSGSTDFTSSNPWQEIPTPKGFIERNLATGEHRFHELPPSRPYIDLPAIDATGLGAADVDAAIRAAVETQSIDNAVVRLKIRGITREVAHALDQRALREYRRRALNFHLDEERAERLRPEVRAMVRTLGTVADRVTRDLRQRELANDVDRDELVVLANRYLEQADDKLGDRTEAEAVPIAAAVPTRKAS